MPPGPKKSSVKELFRSFPFLEDEWEEAKTASQRRPENLRPSMPLMKHLPWRTNAIDSSVSLASWIAEHEPSEDIPHSESSSQANSPTLSVSTFGGVAVARHLSMLSLLTVIFHLLCRIFPSLRYKAALQSSHNRTVVACWVF